MKTSSSLLLVLGLTLSLAACTDTTGLSASSSKGPTGSPNASVVVVEFGDFQCPACKTAYTSLVQPLLQKYGTQMRLEFHHFPLRSIHRYALDLAEASECAADQQKFWEFVDYAYIHQNELDKSSVEKWGKALGLDTTLYNRCVASKIKKQTVLNEYDEGVKAGVQGTPTFFVNGKQTEATLPALSAAIEEAQKGMMQRL